MGTDIIKATQSMVADYMKSFDPSHDKHHIDRVRGLALDLADDLITRGNTVDLEIVELAALCHDVGDPKYYHGDIAGGDIVESFLTQQGYDTGRANWVARIVNHVGFRKELAWDDTTDDPSQVHWRNTCLELFV